MNNHIKAWLFFVFRMLFFAIALLWPAGTWQWWDAWIIISLWTVFGVVLTHYLLQNDPALLAERMKFIPLDKDQKVWDKVLMLLFFIAAIGLYILPVFLTLLLIIRTYFEDRTLHEELEGYPEYTRQTRYRLIPWIW